MLSRLIYGARLSLFMGVTPVLHRLLHRLRLGILAGYVGGRVNTRRSCAPSTCSTPSRRCCWRSPCRARSAPAFGNALLSLTIVFIPPIARVAEAVTTQVRTRDFVEAARASGASGLTIIRVHVLGNVLGPIFVYATSLISRLHDPRLRPVLPRPRRAAAGARMGPDAEHAAHGHLRAALVAALPGVVIFITSISFNLFSDGLRSAMDVKN